MKKTQRTIAEKMAYICRSVAILILLFSSIQVYSQCPMVCHNVNLSLDTIVGGKTTLVPNDLLSNPASCQGGMFILEMFDPFGNSIGNMVDCQWAGYTLIGKVTDTISKNSCWSKVKIEDKAGPNLTCVKDTISCLELNSYSIGTDRFPLGNASDNCGISAKVSISVICKERDCTDPFFVAFCERKVIATDQWGLTSSCVDSLWISKDTLSNLVGPRDTMINCEIADTIAKNAAGNPIPERIGVPTIKGHPVWPNYSVCKIISRYSDTEYPICGKSRKIRRQWTVTDWCTKKDTSVIQWIKIMDTSRPVLLEPLSPITASAGAHDCNTYVSLPRPKLKDCSGVKSIDYTIIIVGGGYGGALPAVISGSFNGAFSSQYLPAGHHEITYNISDSCGNVLQVVQVVDVLDLIPPTPVCDEHTATTLDPQQCWARVYAADLDNGSHDNCCSTLYFAAIEMDTLTRYQSLLKAKIISKYGQSAYNAKSANIDLLIDRYINCKYFNDYIDLGRCGNVQVVLRVYEACHLPQYDPHVNGDSRHAFYCKSAYGSNNSPYGNDQGAIDALFADKILGSYPVSSSDLSLIPAPKNYNDCMVWINVADKQAPTCEVNPEKFAYCDGVPYTMTALWNKSDSYFNPLCEGANGKYDTAYLNLDKYDTGLKIDALSLFDAAKFKDNCGKVTVDSSTSGALNNCGSGILTRTWTGTDACAALSVTCSQKLNVLHRSDFEVLFPKDIETSCITDLAQFNHPTGDNYPKIFDNDCEQVGISFEDVRYDIAVGACYKIVRTWKLIDWCVYNPNDHFRRLDYIVDTSAEYRANPDPLNNRHCTFRWLKDNNDGYITYTQIIKVINTIAPTVTKRDSMITCADNAATCFGHIKLKFGAKDDCTDSTELKWTILFDLGNNGVVDKTIEVVGPTATVDGDYAIGTHKITFIAKDGCGNETRRENVVNVKLCKKPTPYLLNGLAADLMPIDANKDGIPESGMLVIWAKDFDAGSYASCGQKIVVFSFSSDTTYKSITFTCDSLGQRIVRVWVTDSYGNQDVASTYILIQDNNKACTGGVSPSPLIANIKGEITTEDKLDVEKVNVHLNGSSLASITKSDGAYAFENMQLGGTYKVMPKKDINPMNGVSTLDLLLIQKHILGIQLLNSPYKMIAADVNKSNDISSVDLLELRKLILGVYDSFQGNESWRFVPSAFKFRNNANPFDGGFPESHDLAPFNAGVTANFVGIKVGDVNGSVTPNQLMGSESRSLDKEVILTTPEVNFNAHQMITVPVFADQITNIVGYQFTLSFDSRSLQFVNVESQLKGMSEANFGTNKSGDGFITTSFASVQSLNTDKPLFTLHLRASSSGKLSESLFINSKITTAEAYTPANEVIGVQLSIQNGAAQQVSLMQNTPNPFNSQTKIGFVLPIGSEASLVVFDLDGRIVKKIQGQYQKGYNEVVLKKHDLRVGGVYYYQLQTNGFTATRKMIVVE